MTFAPSTAAASRPAGGDPAAELRIAELTDSAAVAQYIARGCLADAPLGRVGLEVEAHCHDPQDPCRRPGWDE
ncbi:ergothioneine biosynthesis glutamate--cysteine ligase EgtA, partial [Mycobacterium avium subsp. hominissuis]|nr:ergothioneine biosynthesis glutamate--cysteine ligase EgtA [Mycobacterium avium subsp. hominissuis]